MSNIRRRRGIRHNRGQAIVAAVIFFLIISMTIVLGVAAPVFRELGLVHETVVSKGSFFAAEAGSEDVMYRLMHGVSVASPVLLTLGSYSVSTAIADVSGGKETVAVAAGENFFRKVKTHLSNGNGASFHYGVQSGEGGIFLENNSVVHGNVYSNGAVTGENSNLIGGDVISAGPSGRIDGVHATSSVYAHSILDATIDKDAYYVTISNSTVSGTLHPGSLDQATSSLPISDSQIGEWENDAAAGGTISSPCPYVITDDMTIGPKKITCDLEIDGNPRVTLGGAVWVVGNITIKNGPVIQVAPSLFGRSVVLIADNPADQTTGSKIDSNNSATFSGSGGSSYVMLISQNRSAERGGSEIAINVDNSAHGAFLVYAGHGEIELGNSISLKEVTAYKIHLKNSASVTYETGLGSSLFTSGPSGGYIFDLWREVP